MNRSRDPLPKADFDALYADLVRLPDNVVGEIIDGELHAHPRPAPLHAFTHSGLLARINRYFADDDGGGPGGWWILNEPECLLGENVLVPDIAGWRRETMPVLPSTTQFTVRPDWVCEILSPSTIVVDRNRKLPIYVASGVRHAWLVDPLQQTVEVYDLADSHTEPSMVSAGMDILHAPPFEGVGIELSRVFVDS